MRRQTRKERKRILILQSAAVLFSEKDIHLVLMDDVAAHAGVGKGTLYRYFPTKDDLYVATVLEAWDRVRVELEAVFQEESPPAENLEKMARRVLAFFWPRRHFIALLRDGMENPEWRRRREVVIELVENELKRTGTVEALSANDLRITVELFLGMFRAALLYRDDRNKPESLARLIVTVFLRGLGGLTVEGRKGDSRDAADAPDSPSTTAALEPAED